MLIMNKLSSQIKEDCKTKPNILKRSLQQIARMKGEIEQINTYTRADEV
jgi:hypothetical protein